MATFDAKYNEFLVNNNVLSNYQHTKHISTTEPLYLDGMPGSDNIVHKPARTASDPYNGHEYVDLGLPSGTLWATMNVGATNVTDYGNYYMYGMGSKTYDNADTPYAGTEDPLVTSADTAAQEWGGEWHMPTQEQMRELVNHTTYQWVEDYEDSGINGGLFTAQNGNLVFFPAAGGYNINGLDYVGQFGIVWSSSPFILNSNKAFTFELSAEGTNVRNQARTFGISIRPVIGNALQALPPGEIS